MARANVVTGAHVLLYINGRMFGRVMNFRWGSNTARRPVYGLDNGLPYELMPTTTSINGTIGVYKLIGDGGLEAPGVVARFEELPREKYFSISLIERSTDTTIFRADYCSVENQSWDVPVRGVVTGSITFTALSWNNEVTATSE